MASNQHSFNHNPNYSCSKATAAQPVYCSSGSQNFPVDNAFPESFKPFNEGPPPLTPYNVNVNEVSPLNTPFHCTKDGHGHTLNAPNQSLAPPHSFPMLTPPPFPPPFSPYMTNPAIFPPLREPALPVLPPLDTSLPPPAILPNQKICTQPSIQLWLKYRKPVATGLPAQNIRLSISEYKNKVTNLSIHLKQLEKMATHLQVMSKSLEDDQWLERKMEILKQMALIENLMKNLKEIPESDILLLLKKRRSKRARLKRKRDEMRELKKEEKAFCELEHLRIDMWLEKMMQQVERTRREEDIKKQADSVLSEVFQKKSEAKKMLGLLTTLGKLRNARILDRESKGEFVSKEAAATFNVIIENLKKRWINQINGYHVEEKGLRVMLSDAQVKRCHVEKSISKQIQQEWLGAMFGEGQSNCPQTNSNLEGLINIRRNWDKFVVDESAPIVGSRIPIGWVLPAPPSTDTWASYLKQ